METIKKIVIGAIIILLCACVMYIASRLFLYGIAVLGCVVYGMEIPAFTLIA